VLLRRYRLQVSVADAISEFPDAIELFQPAQNRADSGVGTILNLVATIQRRHNRHSFVFAFHGKYSGEGILFTL
jgi:hypothetical protein